jgi:alanine racemase
MPRPIHATIFPAAIAHNLAIARRHAPHSFLWAVVKANAYGHGIERVFAGLQGEHVADGLAVLDFAEAQRVRALGWTKPILMLEGCFDAADIATCAALNLTTVIHSIEQLALHAAHPTSLSVQIKINSGMNRLGFAWHDLAAMYAMAQRLLTLPHLRVDMWLTHFADADVAGRADAPLAAFEKTVNTLFAQYPQLKAPLSTSNSAAIGAVHAALHSAVRSGIMTYGSSPYAGQTAQQLGLQPAMHLDSQLIAIQSLRAGAAVGYGSTFIAPQSMRIGIVACGYADGYPRHAATGTPIVVDSVRTRTVGRVSMDMLAVDLSPVPHAAVGSAVQLWGDRVSIDEVAHSAGTIGYELMCALALRVPTTVV